MVAAGYWLKADGHGWRRVRLEDYQTAAVNAGFSSRHPSATIPKHFHDIPHGIRGTTTDPNTTPHEVPRLAVTGRPAYRNPEEAIRGLTVAFDQIAAVCQAAIAALMPALTALRQILEAEVHEAERRRVEREEREQSLWYAMHDHGDARGAHGHSVINQQPGDDHTGVETMTWEQFQSYTQAIRTATGAGDGQQGQTTPPDQNSHP